MSWRSLHALALLACCIDLPAVADGMRQGAQATENAIALNQRDNGVTQIFEGVPFEVYERAIEARYSSQTEMEAVKAELAEAAEQLGVTQDAMLTFFAILGRENVPDGRWREMLVEIAERHLSLLERLSVLDGADSPRINALKLQIREAITAGDYERAERLMREVRAERDARMRRIEEYERLMAQAKRHEWTRAAEEVAAEAKIAHLRRYLPQAAALYQEAADLALKVGDERSRFEWLRIAAIILRTDDRQEARLEVIEINEILISLAESVVENDLDVKADLYVDIGHMFEFMDHDEPNTAHLEAALESYRTALQIQPREPDPIYWGLIQKDIGLVLELLYERQGEVPHLEAALEAYRAAQQALTRERHSMEWAVTIGAEGRVMLYLAERTGNTPLATRAIDQIETARDFLREHVEPSPDDHFWLGYADALDEELKAFAAAAETPP